MRKDVTAVVAAGLLAAATADAPAQQSFGEAGGGGFGTPPAGQQRQFGNQGGQLGVPPAGQQGQFGNQGGQFGVPPAGQQGQFGNQGGQFGVPPGGQPGQSGGQGGGQFGGQPGGQGGQFGAAPGGPPGQFGGQAGQPGQFGGQGGQFGAAPGGQPGQFGGQGGQPGNQGGMPPQYAQMLDQLAQYERQDFGVQPTNQLHQGAMHGRTPNQIPGGQVITTKGLIELIQGQQTPFLLFDVLGAGETLPGAIPAVQAATPGGFNDQISQQMGQFLQQATRGNTQVPLIFYCASVECWMSYNAALRAINLGYSNVLWYRGGLDAWKHAGGPTVPAGGGYGQQQGRY